MSEICNYFFIQNNRKALYYLRYGGLSVPLDLLQGEKAIFAFFDELHQEQIGNIEVSENNPYFAKNYASGAALVDDDKKYLLLFGEYMHSYLIPLYLTLLKEKWPWWQIEWAHRGMSDLTNYLQFSPSAALGDFSLKYYNVATPECLLRPADQELLASIEGKQTKKFKQKIEALIDILNQDKIPKLISQAIKENGGCWNSKAKLYMIENLQWEIICGYEKYTVVIGPRSQRQVKIYTDTKEAVITTKDSKSQDYVFSLYLHSIMMYGPDLLQVLQKRKRDCYLPREDQVKSGAYIDINAKEILLWWGEPAGDYKTIDLIEKVWPGWKVKRHTKGWLYQVKKSGRNSLRARVLAQQRMQNLEKCLEYMAQWDPLNMFEDLKKLVQGTNAEISIAPHADKHPRPQKSHKRKK